MAGASARGVRRPRIVLLGAPGAGKGTQAERLSARFGIPRISTGEMLRDNVARGTEVGRTAEPLLAKGLYVPDDVLVPMVSQRLAAEDCRGGFILDGFPRTVPQAKLLGSLVDGGLESFAIFHVGVPREELMRRLGGRGREDDRGTIVESRLAEHEAQTRPVVEWLGRNARLSEVDGFRDAETVTSEIVSLTEAQA